MGDNKEKRYAAISGYVEDDDLIYEIIQSTDVSMITYLRTLSHRLIVNPLVKFNNDVETAKEFNANRKKCNRADQKPEVLRIADMSMEDFEKELEKYKRIDRLFRGKANCTVLTLLLRSYAERHGAPPEDAEYVSEDLDYVRKEMEGSLYSKKDWLRQTKLTDHVKKIKKMREALLAEVMGQDHVVHAFAQGLFNSSVLENAEREDRKGPLAVFTFAGPPGVGKTFLAEQAAKYLDLPYKRFDMTAYSSSGQNSEGLIGFDYTYRNSTPGVLTTFVMKNPKCVILFDEIEKAHPQVIQIFYQLLDSGIVTDKYFESKKNAAESGATHGDLESRESIQKAMETDPNVSFKDVIVIFTSNVGRSLYEGDDVMNASAVSTNTLLNAMRTEINPITGGPFFPAAITSRIATGYPLLFNHLKPYDLVKIIEKEYKRFCDMAKEEYNISVEADDAVILSLLFHEGGRPDVRTLKAQAEAFFKNELYKILLSDQNAMRDLKTILFKTETDIETLPDKIRALFRDDKEPEILFYANRFFTDFCGTKLTGCKVWAAQTVEKALELAYEKDIRFVFIDISMQSADENGKNDVLKTSEQTAAASMAAKKWKDGKRLFKELTEKMPELPVYLLETPYQKIEDELLTSFIRAGARGKVTEPEPENFDGFAKEVEKIGHQLYMQDVAANLAAERKVLTFETAPAPGHGENEGKLVVRLRNFELKRAVEADDVNDLLSEAEKPDVRFSDIIGAEAAKKDLQKFIVFLQNPRKYISQGNKIPKGILLYGRPGTGKTMLARALAGEADVAFFPVSASTFVDGSGRGTAAVHELFIKARRYAPSIIFIDEVDAIAKPRGVTASNDEANTLNAFLTEMDGFVVDPKRPVFVVAATNYGIDGNSGGIGVLDEAFVSRFDSKVFIGLPNKEERKQLINMLLDEVDDKNVDPKTIENAAMLSFGMNCRTLSKIVANAISDSSVQKKPLDDKMLMDALKRERDGEKKYWPEDELEKAARHEAGHAVMYYLAGNIPGYVTIEARGGAGGYMMRSEEELARNVSTKKDVLDEVRTALGGRAAEIFYYGKEDGITTGPANDLERATFLIQRMIAAYGMDEIFGLATMDPTTAMHSSELRDRVNEVLKEEMEYTIDCIAKNKSMVDCLVEALKEKMYLTGDEIEELLKEDRAAGSGAGAKKSRSKAKSDSSEAKSAASGSKETASGAKETASGSKTAASGTKRSKSKKNT